VAPEELSFTVASEGLFQADRSAEEQDRAPLIPVFQVRRGVTDSADFGFRVSGVALGADAKLNLVRERYFDLALDPGFLWTAWGSAEFEPVAYFQLPVILDLNLRALSLIASPGLLYVAPLGFADDDDLALDQGLHTRLGLGVQFRGESVALQPEVTLLGTVQPVVFPTDVAVGVGISFVNLPVFE
jgi:hypothetical protein